MYPAPSTKLQPRAHVLNACPSPSTQAHDLQPREQGLADFSGGNGGGKEPGSSVEQNENCCLS